MAYKQTQIQKTTDLPANSSAPVEIPCIGFSVVWGYCDEAFQLTFAATAAEGLSRINSKDTRETISSGGAFSRVTDGLLNLYVRANGAVLVADGLSYGLGVR